MLKTKEFPGWMPHVTESHRTGFLIPGPVLVAGMTQHISSSFVCLTDTLDTLTQPPSLPLPPAATFYKEFGLEQLCKRIFGPRTESLAEPQKAGVN